jgi:oligo-1,6-glucosidase
MKQELLEGVVYQIWPRSFKDGNGDGIGDLLGIIEKLDYLKDLGIRTIWLSPIYASPNTDYGYDISDYYSIHPDFGTMADFERLVVQAKERNIAIVMDLVVSHTSDQHLWFLEAKSNPNSKYRDYYFFKPAKAGGPPNNWISLFGGSAWTKAPQADTYVLTLWTPTQVDLNWDNPAMRQDIYTMMRWWMDKGIAGFRMDAINLIDKHPDFPDKNPHKKGYQFADDLIRSRPKSYEYLAEMNREVLSKYPGIYIGEGILAKPEEVSRYSGIDEQRLDLMFHFDQVFLGNGPLGKYDFRKFYHWTIPQYKATFFAWQLAAQQQHFRLGNFLSNHDNGRPVSRFGDDQRYRRESAMALLTHTLTSVGTPFIYQGEEIGMTNFTIDQKDWKDYEAINAFSVLQSMMHVPAFLARKIVQRMTRDLSRTPMQWEDGPYAGFSTSQPWMVINPNASTVNVRADQADPLSISRYVRSLIDLRHAHPALLEGDLKPILENHPHLLAYTRSTSDEQLAILINLAKHPSTFKVSPQLQGELLLSNLPNRGPLEAKMVFAPYEVRILKLGQST